MIKKMGLSLMLGLSLLTPVSASADAVSLPFGTQSAVGIPAVITKLYLYERLKICHSKFNAAMLDSVGITASLAQTGVQGINIWNGKYAETILKLAVNTADKAAGVNIASYVRSIAKKDAQAWYKTHKCDNDLSYKDYVAARDAFLAINYVQTLQDQITTELSKGVKWVGEGVMKISPRKSNGKTVDLDIVKSYTYCTPGDYACYRGHISHEYKKKVNAHDYHKAVSDWKRHTSHKHHGSHWKKLEDYTNGDGLHTTYEVHYKDHGKQKKIYYYVLAT